MRTLRPYLGLFFLALVAFWPLVLHPTHTLYSNSSDLLAQHIPAKYFLVRSLRETGELPLWNPEQYAGSPFVHDIQVGLFYPPHLPLYFISEPAIGPFVSWLLFVHVVLAGWFMYAYARHACMSELAAFVAGVGFMLSPRWMMQLFLAGHIVTQGICWLPLVLLCVERAIQRKRWSWAVGGGVAYAMLILGTHPQWTFYASLLIGAWPLRLLSPPLRFGEGAGGRGLTDATPRRNLLLRWLAVETVVVIIGVALCAVQLLPTIEAAGQSSRASGMGQSWSLDGAKAALFTLIGPPATGAFEPIHWETRGGIGFTLALLCVTGMRLGGNAARVPALIALGVLAYALGGSEIIDNLPGFNKFRMPTRSLLALAFPVAFLAAIGVENLSGETGKRGLRTAMLVVSAIVAIPGLLALLGGNFLGSWISSAEWRLYWIVLSITSLLLFRFAGKLPRKVIVAFIVTDVFLCSQNLVQTRPATTIYPSSPILEAIRLRNVEGSRVYDFEPATPGNGSFLGPGSPLASVYGIPSIRGYNPIDIARYRQFLAFIADKGEPQVAFSSWFTHPVVLDFPIKNSTLFNLVAIRFVITVPQTRIHQFLARETDPNPKSFNFLSEGIQNLPQLTLYENPLVFPRTFVVADAALQAPMETVLNQLKSLDLYGTATLEAWDPARDPLPRSSNSPGPAKIRSHKPNEIVIDLDGKTAGLLVLTDPWYPGWVCRIDGNEVPIWKADYAFRGVMVPEGSREVVFHFEPQSYRRGKWISLTALVFVLLFGFARLAQAVRQNR